MADKTSYTKTITATEFKQNLGMYLDYVMEDNEVVITKNGQKVARLTPYLTDLDRYLLLREQAFDYSVGGKKVSYEEFMEISEKSELRMEYIDGEIVLLDSPSILHQRIIGNLYVYLRQAFKGKSCDVLLAPLDVHLFKPDFKDPDVVQPDLIVACDIDETSQDQRYMGVPTLVVEVLSPSTKRKDMVEKLRCYMLSGVQEYWIVDPINETVITYRFEERDIGSLTQFTTGDVTQSSCFPDVQIAVADVFDDV